jgi:hypothetical protein
VTYHDVHVTQDGHPALEDVVDDHDAVTGAFLGQGAGPDWRPDPNPPPRSSTG